MSNLEVLVADAVGADEQERRFVLENHLLGVLVGDGRRGGHQEPRVRSVALQRHGLARLQDRVEDGCVADGASWHSGNFDFVGLRRQT